MHLIYKGVLNFHVVFLTIYVSFNFIGLYPFCFYSNQIMVEVTYIFLIGLLGFISGMLSGDLLFNKKQKNYTLNNIKKFNKKIKLLLYLGFVVILILAIYQNRQGIILFNEHLRYNNSTIATLINLAYPLIIYFYFTYLTLHNHKNWLFKYILIATILITLSYGYRGAVITIVLVLFYIKLLLDIKVYNKKIPIASTLIYSILIILFGVVIEYIRLTQSYDYLSFYNNINTENVNIFVILFLPFLSLVRYDQEIVERLYLYFENHDFFNLKLLFSNISTLLPGEQLATRNIIGSITTSRMTDSGKPWSITSTIQGNLYADGGYMFVFVGFFLISIFMIYLRNKLINRIKVEVVVYYSFFSILFIKSIHSGYLDASVYIMIILMMMIAVYSKIKV